MNTGRAAVRIMGLVLWIAIAAMEINVPAGFVAGIEHGWGLGWAKFEIGV
jgi:hypothetical protein